MSRPGTPSKGVGAAASGGAAARSHREDVLQFLDNLDSFEESGGSLSKSGSAAASGGSAGKTGATAGTASPGPGKAGGASDKDAQDVLDFLDEIVTSRDRKKQSGVSPSPGAASSTFRKPDSSVANLSRSSSRTTLKDAAGPTVRKSNDSATRPSSYLVANTSSPARAASPANAPASLPAQAAEKLQEATPPTAGASAGGWGWGSVWSQASTALQQARQVAEEQVSKNLKDLPRNIPSSITSMSSSIALPASPADASASANQAVTAATAQAQRWKTGVASLLQSMDVDKLRKDITSTGLNALKEIMDAVAPPIAEHEVIEVWLSHDMVGYEGVETLVYRALAKVMEQVEGGDLVVNKGASEDRPNANEKQPVTGAGGEDEDERNLNVVSGLPAGYKLAEANLEALIKRHYKKPDPKPEGAEAVGDKQGHARTSSQSITVPVTVCPVYMRIQPVLAPLPFSFEHEGSSATAPAAGADSNKDGSNTPRPLQSTSPSDEQHLFFILLLRDPTNELVHRSISQSMPSKWLDIPFEENEWVEDIMVEVIRRSVEIIGEEYVKGRMHGRLLKNAKTETIFEEQEETEQEKEDRAELMAEASAGVSA